MILLNKKRLSLVLGLILVSVCVFSLDKMNFKSSPTVALPVSNKVIIIDAGHGR